MARVIVQARSERPGEAAGREPDIRDVRAITSEFGATLEPLHPNVAHPLLDRYFVAVTGDEATANALIQRLRQHPQVEAVYIAPAPELP